MHHVNGTSSDDNSEGEDKGCVVHVVDNFSGGVSTAVSSYITSLPTIDHHLVYRVQDANVEFPMDMESRYRSVTRLSTNPLIAMKTLRRVIAGLAPIAVHAHSSYAGLFTRLLISRKSLRIIYTPHGFAFERRDVSRATRQFYRIVEKLLAGNTTVFAPCSTRELGLVHDLAPKVPSRLVPNIGTLVGSTRPIEPPLSGEDTSRKCVITVARISAAKDPKFFIEVVAEYRRIGNARFIWIGTGDDDLTTLVKNAGIEVTGWQSPQQVAGWMAHADAMLQTSRWESMPMTFLEAESLSLPTIARKVESLDWLPDCASGISPVQIAQRLHDILHNSDAKEENLSAWSQTFAVNTIAEQRSSLEFVYFGPIGVIS